MVTVKTASVLEPIPLADMKVYLRVDTDQTLEDDLIQSQMDGVVSEIETSYNVSLMTQTVEEYYDGYCKYYELTRGPVQSITDIDYLLDDVWTEYTLTDASTDLYSKIARVRMHESFIPDDALEVVRFTYTAGWTAATLPAYILNAIRTLMRVYYCRLEDREKLRKAAVQMLQPLKQRVSRV